MWTMGKDFNYQYAHTWFRQMDKFLHYVNQVSPLQNHYKCFLNKFNNFVLILLILFFQFGCSSAVYIKVLNCLAIWKGKRKKKIGPKNSFTIYCWPRNVASHWPLPNTYDPVIEFHHKICMSICPRG